MEGYKLIDLSYLEQVCGGNKAMVLKMIDLFVDQTPKQIESMNTYLKEENWQEFFNVAHKAKSSLAMMGVKSLQRPMENLEDFSKNKKELGSIPDILKHVGETCQLILKEIESNYASISK